VQQQQQWQQQSNTSAAAKACPEKPAAVPVGQLPLFEHPADWQKLSLDLTQLARQHSKEFLRAPDSAPTAQDNITMLPGWLERVHFRVLDVHNEEVFLDADFVRVALLQQLLDEYAESGIEQAADSAVLHGCPTGQHIPADLHALEQKGGLSSAATADFGGDAAGVTASRTAGVPAASSSDLQTMLSLWQAWGTQDINEAYNVQKVAVAAFYMGDAGPLLLLVVHFKVVLPRAADGPLQSLCGAGEVGIFDLWENGGTAGTLEGRQVPRRFLGALGACTQAMIARVMRDMFGVNRMVISPCPPVVSI
jgi:hypothetical protein